MSNKFGDTKVSTHFEGCEDVHPECKSVQDNRQDVSSKLFEKSNLKWLDHLSDFTKKDLMKILSALEIIKSKVTWKDCKTMLPEYDQSVLIYDGCSIYIGHNEPHENHEPNFYIDASDEYHPNITHWMPLPPAPEVE